MSKQNRTVMLGTKVTPDISERLDRLAERMGTTRSDLAFQCVRNGLDELEHLVPVAESRLGGALARFACQFLSDPAERAELVDELERLQTRRKAAANPRLPYASETS